MDGPVLMLPVYHVEWLGFILRGQPNRERVVVSVTVFGATKELVEYHVLDDSLFLRPRIQVKDSEKLVAISDEEFRKFDMLQRSNLLFQATGHTESLLAFPVPEAVLPADVDDLARSLAGVPPPLAADHGVARALLDD